MEGEPRLCIKTCIQQGGDSVNHLTVGSGMKRKEKSSIRLEYGRDAERIVKGIQELSDLQKALGLLVALWVLLKILFATLAYTGHPVPLGKFEILFSDLSGGVVAILFMVYTGVRYFLAQVRKLDKLDGIEDLHAKLDEAREVGLDLVRASIDFLNKTLNETVFDAKDWQKYGSEFPRRIREGISSLGAVLKAWSDQIRKCRQREGCNCHGSLSCPNASPPILTQTWLTCFETYFREEAFDVRKGELVTNGRNYPFLLVATLASMLESVPKGRFLHYHVVTPVNPKDWYNWPHGRMRPKAYCEAEFLSLFRHCLNELLVWSRQNGDRLVHRRYLLTRDGTIGRDAFGWELDSFENLCGSSALDKGDINQCLVLDVSIPVEEIPSNGFCGALQAYYRELVKPLRPPGAFSWPREKPWITPMFGSHWTQRLESLDQGPRVADVLALARTLKADKPTESSITELINAAKAASERELESLLNKLRSIGSRVGTGFAAQVEKIATVVDEMVKCSSDKECDFPALIRFLHEQSLLVASQWSEEEDLIKPILLNLLRLRAVSLRKGSPMGFVPLGSEFAKQLHTSPDDAIVAKLTAQHAHSASVFDVHEWSSPSDVTGLEPEAAVFAVSESKDMPRADEWKLALATDITYPFETAKIRIIDDPPSVRRYGRAMQELHDGLASGRAQRLVDLMK